MKKPKKIKQIKELAHLLQKLEQNKKTKQSALKKVEAWQKKVRAQIAQVITAVPLTEKELTLIQDTLILLKKEPVLVKNVVKKDILGGLKIVLGPKVVDLSLAGQLNEILKQLSKKTN